MSSETAIQVSGLCHDYGSRRALDQLDLEIQRGEVFVFLGPNGGGKTTLFRLLSTLIPLQTGRVRILDCELGRQTREIQARIGVVFQAASLDKKLTVAENIRYQAALYGLGGSELAARQQQLLKQLGLEDRSRDLAETLSGGLRRRVELAKGMIHQPQLLLMDEPSTGLDPGARSDLWKYLQHLRSQFGVTIVLTTHLLEEVDRADRIAILHAGRLVALDTPDALRATVGGDSITIETDHPESLCEQIQQRFQVAAAVIDGRVRFEQPDGHRWIARLVDAFADQIVAVRLGKPTLEDVFIDKTGHRFWNADGASS